jgi:hypothetical protein
MEVVRHDEPVIKPDIIDFRVEMLLIKHNFYAGRLAEA